jgi:hypothetical protein
VEDPKEMSPAVLRRNGATFILSCPHGGELVVAKAPENEATFVDELFGVMHSAKLGMCRDFGKVTRLELAAAVRVLKAEMVAVSEMATG